MKLPIRRRRPRICVLGAGCVGLSVADHLFNSLNGQEKEFDLCVMADSFLQDTTSGGAGGLWEPYGLINTDWGRICKWAQTSYKAFESMVPTSSSSSSSCSSSETQTETTTGVQRLLYYELFTDASEAQDIPEWAQICPSFRVLPDTKSLTEAFPSLPSRQPGQLPFVAGWEFSTFSADQSLYLPYLTKRLSDVGVSFITRHVSSLNEFIINKKNIICGDSDGDSDVAEGNKFDIIVNCTGLGAAKLVGRPTSMYPMRGQVLRVPTPPAWLSAADGDGNNIQFCVNWQGSYIIPNIGCLVLGGTRGGPTDWNTTVSPEDSIAIRSGIATVFPELAEVPAVKEWVGLRPCNNTGVCLESHLFFPEAEAEAEVEGGTGTGTGTGTVPILLVHNYGHGGSGITLAAGCAKDVVENHVLPHINKWWVFEEE